MKDEVYNASGFGAFTQVNSIAKSALNAPSSQSAMIQAQKDIHSLVTGGKIQVRDNMHKLLGTVNTVTRQPNLNGAAVPTVYHDFDSLNIFVKKLS